MFFEINQELIHVERREELTYKEEGRFVNNIDLVSGFLNRDGVTLMGTDQIHAIGSRAFDQSQLGSSPVAM